MKEGVDHLRLQLRRDAAHHAKVKKREVAGIHHQQISRMRIGVKEPVFQQLLQISANQQPVDFYCRDAARTQRLRGRSPLCRE